MSLRDHLQGLRQRFDARALRPPAPQPTAAQAAQRARHAAAGQALWAWCAEGAGPGGGPLWPPAALPPVARRWAVAGVLAGDAAVRPPEVSDWADAWALQRDGSVALALAAGAGGALALRLRVKVADAAWWRPRRADDPWDAGWLRTEPAALAWLSDGWQPRRATLLLAEAGPGAAPLPQADLADLAAVADVARALQRRSAGFRHPVRWLWVGEGAAAAVAGAGPVFTLGG
jgi:hypothetical protein